ncbi:MAG: winged helix-turn-helix transcriptional regulator [Elusimicrobiota bacterium]
MTKDLKEIGKRSKELEGITKEKVYNEFKRLLEKNHRRPSMADISERVGVSRERVRQLLEKLKEEGKLIEFSHYKNQNVELPHEWIEKHTS